MSAIPEDITAEARKIVEGFLPRFNVDEHHFQQTSRETQKVIGEALMRAEERGAKREREAEPVAWRVWVNDKGRTMYVYTECLPFEPLEDSRVRVLRKPEPLYRARSSK